MADLSSSASSGGGVADQARDQVQQVAGQASEKLQQASGQVGDRVKQEIDNRSTALGAQVGTTAHSLRTVGKELRNQGDETPAKVADQLADKVEQVGQYLSESDGSKILSDIEDFGRKQPWLVIGAGVAVGIAAARFLKASSQRRYDTMYGWRLPAAQASNVTGTVPSMADAPPPNGPGMTTRGGPVGSGTGGAPTVGTGTYGTTGSGSTGIEGTYGTTGGA